ncbi:hypothetical protein B0H10DRAFT_2439218 [Mycena sp. CBHHK59/15]|nr:hypothetical protein B0H10DRAFT_2439218 [Mycena sp. CBHHK59/15]
MDSKLPLRQLSTVVRIPEEYTCPQTVVLGLDMSDCPSSILQPANSLSLTKPANPLCCNGGNLRSRAHSFRTGKRRMFIKTKSDSELVVQLYKRDGFNLLFSLRGEFAFVLYDVKRRLLFSARDRFGIKPLYYTISEGRIMFASEMKAFLGLGLKAEWDIDSIVHNGEFGDDRTVFKGVNKLLPGNYAVCRRSGYIKVQSYWDFSYPAATTRPSETLETMISTVREHLVEAVRLRLRADVPLAVYLSGGLDSSSVAGIATHLLRANDPSAKLATFTLAFPEDEATNEAPIAARTAAHLGANVHMIAANEAKLVGVLEEAIWHTEQANTTFQGAGRILLSRAVRSKGYKVVLSGEGSDEVFAGYPWYFLDYLRDADSAGIEMGLKLPTDTERGKMLAAHETGSMALTQNFTNISYPLKGSKDLLKVSNHHVATTMTPFYRPMFHPDVQETVGAPEIARCIAEGIDPRVRRNSVSGNWHSLNVAQYVTAKSILSHFILNQMGDRADMANAIESRVPFLDHHLVEYVNTLPPSMKVMPSPGPSPGQWTLTEKWILRHAVKPFVTEELYLRKKVPFNPPPRPKSAAGLGPLQTHLKARITQENVERLGFLHWPYIEETLNEYIDAPAFPGHGAIDHNARILMGVLSFIPHLFLPRAPPARRVSLRLRLHHRALLIQNILPRIYRRSTPPRQLPACPPPPTRATRPPYPHRHPAGPRRPGAVAGVEMDATALALRDAIVRIGIRLRNDAGESFGSRGSTGGGSAQCTRQYASGSAKDDDAEVLACVHIERLRGWRQGSGWYDIDNTHHNKTRASASNPHGVPEVDGGSHSETTRPARRSQTHSASGVLRKRDRSVWDAGGQGEQEASK